MRLRSIALVPMIIALVLVSALPALAQGSDLAAAVNWLKSKQAADGGFSDGFSDGSSAPATAEAVLAAAAAGQDTSTWGSPSPLDYLAAQAPTLNESGPLAKTILAVTAAGLDPANFAGTNLVQKLQGTYNADAGAFKGLVNDHAFGILALNAAGAEIPAKATATLEGLQADDGGWSFDGQSQSDTNSTAVAIQALLAGGRAATSEPITKALAFLKTQQNEDGGFPYSKPNQFGTATDANSTAYVIQALLASGQNLADWKNPDKALAALQLPEGAFEYQTGQGANYLATAQAVPALAGTTFVKLPKVSAAKAPAAAPATAPATLPTTGSAGPSPLLLLLGGLVLLLAGTRLARSGRAGER
ncbi:MAG: terpene cyclase/mutase family protein [Ardenticatenaceae bacterium]|nr:terpene cyclase/mutase family protein [Ardenticatenaceae bacterium]HBY94296.1 cell wall anchor protein [Chloroflexota bacterium]